MLLKKNVAARSKEELANGQVYNFACFSLSFNSGVAFSSQMLKSFRKGAHATTPRTLCGLSRVVCSPFLYVISTRHGSSRAWMSTSTLQSSPPLSFTDLCWTRLSSSLQSTRKRDTKRGHCVEMTLGSSKQAAVHKFMHQPNWATEKCPPPEDEDGDSAYAITSSRCFRNHLLTVYSLKWISRRSVQQAYLG